MEYFKAIELETKPFIQWDGWAHSLEQLIKMGEENNPLIISEDSKPALQFGVCPLKIVDGVLVPRTTKEMDIFKNEYNAVIAALGLSPKINNINKGVFVFDGNYFPMNAAARLQYRLIKINSGMDVEVIKIDGTIANIASTSILVFLSAYYNRLIGILIAAAQQPKIKPCLKNI